MAYSILATYPEGLIVVSYAGRVTLEQVRRAATQQHGLADTNDRILIDTTGVEHWDIDHDELIGLVQNPDIRFPVVGRSAAVATDERITADLRSVMEVLQRWPTKRRIFSDKPSALRWLDEV